jgi:uncharacterized membrane protein
MDHHLLDFFVPAFEWVVFFLQLLSIVILLWGVLLAGYEFIRAELRHANHFRAIRFNNFIKNFLGSYILLSLEVLIAADIVESIIKPTLQDIGKLAALVIIRTVISYFLHKEIEDAQTIRKRPKEH